MNCENFEKSIDLRDVPRQNYTQGSNAPGIDGGAFLLPEYFHEKDMFEGILQIAGVNRPHVKIREVQDGDLERFVDVDMKGFKSVYGINPHASNNYESLRDDIREMLGQRIKILDPKWIQVAVVDGQVEGYLMACPTNKDPKDFVSWEDTTNNGILTGTYDEDGKNAYVICLTTLPKATAVNAHLMLQAKMIGVGIDHGFNNAFFESRIPGFRRWVDIKSKKITIDTSDTEQMDQLAEEYVHIFKTIRGQAVRQDRLLRLYDSIGATAVRVVRDAFQDPPSMNYGVLYNYQNPVPESLRTNKYVKRLVGGLYKFVSNSRLLTNWIFG